MEFTVIDFETANWYRRSACSIGIVKVKNFEIVDTFYSLIKPTPFFFATINKSITKLSEIDVENSPTFKELWPHIQHYFNNQIIAAHNFSFDYSVLAHLAKEYEIDFNIKNGVCTLYASKVAFPKLGYYKLPFIVENVLDKDFKNHHHALEDATMAAEILIHIYKTWRPPTLNGMVNALYDIPLEERFIANPNKNYFNKINYSKLQPDIGFENNTKLKGKSFVFTGDLNLYSRLEASQLIINYGGSVSSGVVKATTHLIVGNFKANKDPDYKSGKQIDAEEARLKGQNIKILSQTDFNDMVTTLQS